MGKRKTISILIACCVSLSVLILWTAGLTRGLENNSMDMRFDIRGSIASSTDITIVSIDEDSLKAFGRWPWRRDLHAKLVSKLTEMGAKVIVYDVLFLEPDLNSQASDRKMAKAIAKSGNVVLGSFFSKITSAGVPSDISFPIKSFLKGSETGFVNINTELDGVNRRVPLIAEYDGKLIPSLAIAGISKYLDKSPEEVIRGIPLNEYNEMLINFSGGYESFPYYSCVSVMKGKLPPDTFKDKIVLIGGIAAGLFDFKAIPYSPNFPGVEIHANAMSNVLLKNYLRPWPFYVTLFFILFFPLVTGFASGRYSSGKVGIFVFTALSGYFLLTYFLFKWNNISAEFVAPALSLFASYSLVTLYNFMIEEKEKRWVKKAFSHYLSARVMDSILANPNSLRLGGQRAELTVLFSDIRGFTSISEELEAEEVVELLNEYFSSMVEVVFKYDGTLDKFIGDAIMALWGAPMNQVDHQKRAVFCALDMIEALKKLQDKWRSEGKNIIDIGIGINTGDMIVGNMGSKDKMEYTVIGDSVNLGSRLEGLTKEYKTHIVISDATYQAVKEFVEVKPLGTVNVKGKAKKVEIYAVTGKKI